MQLVGIGAMHRLLQSRWTDAAGYVHYPVLGAACLDPPVPCPGAIGEHVRGASFMGRIYAAVHGVMVHRPGHEPLALEALVAHWRSCFSCAPAMCGFRVWGAFGELAPGLMSTSSLGVNMLFELGWLGACGLNGEAGGWICFASLLLDSMEQLRSPGACGPCCIVRRSQPGPGEVPCWAQVCHRSQCC